MTADQFWDWFWKAFWAVLIISFFFGDAIGGAFRQIVGRDRRHLKPKEAKKLQEELEAAKTTLAVATDIIREVQTGDKAYAQLGYETRERVDEYLAVQAPVPKLPGKRQL